MILERIVGRDITKPIGNLGFHDVHYLRQMLYCTFKSLHQAQRKLAFHHADLRLANIMELVPETEHGNSEPLTRSTSTPKSGKVQDASTHDVHYVSGVLHPSEIGTTNLQETASAKRLHPLSDGPPDLQADSATQTPGAVLQHSATEQSAGLAGSKAANFKASFCTPRCHLCVWPCLCRTTHNHQAPSTSGLRLTKLYDSAFPALFAM